MGKVSQRDFPYEQLYSGDLDLSIVMSEGGGERAYFEDWMDIVIDAQGAILTNRIDYAGTLKIELLSAADRNVEAFIKSSMTVNEVFPKAIGPVTMSNAEENAYGILPISLSFRDYEWKSDGMLPDAKNL